MEVSSCSCFYQKWKCWKKNLHSQLWQDLWSTSWILQWCSLNSEKNMNILKLMSFHRQKTDLNKYGHLKTKQWTFCNKIPVPACSNEIKYFLSKVFGYPLFLNAGDEPFLKHLINWFIWKNEVDFQVFLKRSSLAFLTT